MNGIALLEGSDRVIAKAWADGDFKSALLNDPAAALRGQGIEIPEGMTVRVLETSDNVINLVLPPPPEMQLVEETLDALEGMDACGCRCGGGGCRCGCGGCVACTCVACTCV